MAPKKNDMLTSKVSDTYFIEVSKIKVVEGFNARKDFGDIPGLAKDIAVNGLTQPLIVRMAKDEKSVLLIDGERRLKAIQYINEKHIAEDGDFLEAKCTFEKPGTDDAGRLVKVFSTGANSKPLTDMEQADVIYRLTNVYNKKIKEIARMIGRPQTVVSNLLELHGASHEIKEAVRAKKLSPTAARVLAKASEETQKKVLEKAAASKKAIKVREVETDMKGTSTQVSTRVIKNKVKKIQGMIKEGKVNAREYNSIIKGLELAMGLWELP